MDAGFQYTLGGLRVESGLRLPWPRDTGFFDIRTRIRARSKNGEELGQTWPLPGIESAELEPVWVSPDGQTIWLEDTEGPATRTSAAIRRGVPYASLLQGATVLHGSAVAEGARSAVFVGASGVGKSTLASELGHRGFRLLADDLTPCRSIEGRDLVPSLEDGERVDRALALLCFLEREPGVRAPRWTRLSAKQSCATLLRQGFGDLQSPDLWHFQFGAYAQLAARVPAWRLQVEDDADLLSATADLVAQELRCRFQAMPVTS